MMAIHIRSAEMEDLPLLLTWMNDLVGHIQGTNDPYVADLMSSHQNNYQPLFNEGLLAPDKAVYIAHLDGNPVGFALGKVTKPFVEATNIERVGLIELCWVEPSFRQRGIARALIKEMEQWFLQQGVDYSELYFLVANNEAQSAWLRMGYKPFRIAARKSLL